MAEHTTAKHTERLIALRQLDSADKTRRVIVALNATLGAGGSLTIAGLARRAGVSRRFIYDHPELRAEAERRSAETADSHAGEPARAPESPSCHYALTSPTPKPPTIACTLSSAP